ncbi:MAG: histone deacetylase [Desulfobulbaceae bacterium]|nr:histone deacetylase [Desulfobulbaceae bacterium]
MTNQLITIIYDSQFLKHDTGGGEHPEVAERMQVIENQLRNGALASSLLYEQPQPADRRWLLTFHTEAWLFRFEEATLSGRTYIGHPDNQIGFETYDIALLSAGAGLKGIDLLEQDSAKLVFCTVRPPGHHAEPNVPLGFCFLNNCAIAARYWQQKYKRRKICVFDFDAHHGNGIQAAFEEDAETLYISIHEHPSFSYPGTGFSEEEGTGDGKGTILNIPLLPGAGDEQVIASLESEVEEKLAWFQPDAIIIAAGFDAHRLDDMSGLNYSTDLYHLLGLKIAGWTKKYTEGRLLSILEGGYHLKALPESVEAYLSGLLAEL